MSAKTVGIELYNYSSSFFSLWTLLCIEFENHFKHNYQRPDAEPHRKMQLGICCVKEIQCPKNIQAVCQHKTSKSMDFIGCKKHESKFYC